ANVSSGLKRPEVNSDGYHQVNKPLWNNYPSPADVYQSRYLKDNWLLTGLEEVAWRKRADIMSMFIDNGDHTYTVRFFDYHQHQPLYVTVDNFLPVMEGGVSGEEFGDSFHSGVLWPSLVVKAYAQANAYGDRVRSLDGTWSSSYRAVGLLTTDPNAGRQADPGWAWDAITGLNHAAGGLYLSSIIQKWQEGHYVSLHTVDNYYEEIKASTLLYPD